MFHGKTTFKRKEVKPVFWIWLAVSNSWKTWAVITLFTVDFLVWIAHQCACKAIVGNCVLLSQNCLTSIFDCFVMQTTKANCEMSNVYIVLYINIRNSLYESIAKVPPKFWDKHNFYIWARYNLRGQSGLRAVMSFKTLCHFWPNDFLSLVWVQENY